MLIKQTEEMSLPERLAAENTNNQYLQALSYVAVGTIFPYAGKEAPDTYLMCDGAALDITEYSELFNVIGYAFGGENETFNLPDLRGRVIVGINADDEDFVGIGKKGGKKTHTLIEDEMPKHRHKIYHPNNVEGSTESALANTGFPTPSGIKSTFKATMCEVTDSGGNLAHNNLQPYIVVNYIIKAKQAIEKTDFRFPIDKVYSSTSLNAQSGLALDPIFLNKQDKFAAFTQTSEDEYTLDLSAVTGKNRVIVKYSDSEYLAFRQGEVEIAGGKVKLNPLAGEVSMSVCRVSEVGTPQEDTDAANKKYVDEHSGPSWKTLLDITLTAEQGGTTALMLAIEDTEALLNAREIRVAITFPVAEAKAANNFWHSMLLVDADKKSYNCCLLSGYNAKGSANATFFATADIKVFNFKYSDSFRKTFHSLAQLPNPYYTASANSNVNAKELTGGFNVEAIKNSPPYLSITNTADVTFEKGTHIFMEVQQ